MSGEIAASLDEAIALYQRGDLAEAASHFDEVLRHSPDDPVALRLRGLIMVRAGEAAAALPLLARARRLAPHEPLSHLHYGIGLQHAGRHARAAALFRRSAMLMPDNPASWTNFSAALLSLGRGKAARAAARRAAKLAPRLAECWHTLGLAERAEGNTPGSRDAFIRAVQLERRFPQIWVDLGLAWYQLGDFVAAQDAMREALAVQPDFAPAKANLAAFLLLRGDTDAAIDMLRDLLRRDPNFAAARLNLANALLLENEPIEALALLEGEVPAGRDGRHWRAHRAMALLMTGRHTAARAELDAIAEPYGDVECLVLWRRIVLLGHDGDHTAADALAEQLALLVQDEAAALLEHRIIACFDLARFHHQRARKSAAMEHWQRGHHLLARLQPFSRKTFGGFIDASIARYDAARLRYGPRAANADSAPVFIVGLPRSGTSLTEQILASHAQVFGAGERPALHRLLHELVDGAETAESAGRAAALDADVLTSAARRYLEALHALSPGATFVLDKMPGNARHLGFIAGLLPGARIIHCRRDLRDTGLSIFQHRFFGHHPYAHDLADLGWAMGQHERLMAHWRAVMPLPMIEVELADWVDNFSGTLARLLAFLGLPNDPACERFYDQERRVRTASALQVRQPINARGIGRWRSYEAQLTPMIEELRRAGLLGG